MRYILIIGIMGLFTSTVFAQAADPNAIDFSGRMDTVAIGDGLGGNSNLIGFLNIGLQNSDKWEDFEVNYSDHGNFGKLRFGGLLLFDTTSKFLVSGNPSLFADLDGDGVGDIMDGVAFHKGLHQPPYFDSSFTSLLRFTGFPSDEGIVGSVDYDGDGQNDLLCAGNDGSHSYILFYKGGSTFGKTKLTTYCDDSLTLPPYGYFVNVGKFGKNLKPMIILARGKEIYVIKNTTDLAHDSLVLISDTVKGIFVKNVYVTDITGDGIPDLLVTDSGGDHIYIFKGGDDFGTYPLTQKTAFYTLHSPSYLDPDHFDPFNHSFGMSMRAVGDLTGSGIPYLAVNYQIDGLIVHTGISFFYAGGKALDTLYDAIIKIECDGLSVDDTLNSINSTGRTVALVNNFRDANAKYFRDLDFLMSRDCEKIPHVTNPQMVSAVSSNEVDRTLRLKASAGGGFVTIEITGTSEEPHSLSIYNILGQEVISRKIGMIAGSDKEQFTTIGLPDGTYFAMLRGARSYGSVKFPISRSLYDNAPENPAFMGAH